MKYQQRTPYLDVSNALFPMDIILNDEISQNAILGDPGLLYHRRLKKDFGESFILVDDSRRRRPSTTCKQDIRRINN